jgi:hypothetical protein
MIQERQSTLLRGAQFARDAKKVEKIAVFRQSSSSIDSKICYELAQGPLDESWSKMSKHV